MRKVALLAAAGAAVALCAVAASTGARAADQPLPQPVTHQVWDGYEALLADGEGKPGEAGAKNPSSPICTTSGPNTDCEGTAPHNETTIAVDPTDPKNMIGGANDYQLTVSSGGTVNETIYSRAHVTFDGGATWTTYPVRYSGYAATGDPAIAFDADGTAYYATLGFVWSQGGPLSTTPDVLVATSKDGGKTWSSPDRVASGTGSLISPGRFNDKEAIAAWGHGNAIVTWTLFVDGIQGSYGGSPIYASVTHDGGKTWSPGVEISGSASFCAGFSGGDACDQDQGSTPAVLADGSAIDVAFMNYSNDPSGRDQYLVVRVDPQTGQRLAGPYKVAGLYDGFTDYPINVDGRQTYQDSEFRTWAFGNIAADPTNAQHLAVAWSDMRDSTLPAPSDPYKATTNSDVVVSQSYDGGATWSAPTALAVPNDQFMPWASYGPDGRLRVGYFDRSADPKNHAYGYTLATETTAGSLSFGTTDMTGGTTSDPTQGDRWFSGRTPSPDFPNPTTFLGDYSGIDASQGSTATLWTDLRASVTFAGRTGAGEDAYFGAS